MDKTALAEEIFRPESRAKYQVHRKCNYLKADLSRRNAGE